MLGKTIGSVRSWSLGLCLWGLSLANTGFGYEDFCLQRSDPVPIASSYCQGMVIPAEKTRNFLGEGLLCGYGEHSYERTPIDFDEEKWRDLLGVDPMAARNMLRSLPEPAWHGAIQYDTNLRWQWEECQLVTNRSCGTTRVCDGKNHLGEEIDCRDEPKTCYQDVVVTESMFCSWEKTTYDVSFQKTEEEYLDRLANGYDLLPGEHENVVVNNGAGFLSRYTMSPRLTVNEARNHYQITRRTGADYDSGDLTCRHNSNYHIGFDIYPEQRIRSRSGNAFSLPEDVDGEAINALVWTNGRSKDGSSQNRGFPVALRVQDYGASSMTEVARDMGDLFKNIVVRIELYEKSWMPWPWPKATIYIREGEGVVQTLNALSEKQSVRRSQLWELMLASQELSPSKNIYRNHIPWFLYYPARMIFPESSLSYENHLKPGTEYKLRMTVYQKDISIYNQACEDDPTAWDCRFYAGGGWLSPSRYESGYFSDKSLDVEFTTPADFDQRSWWSTFWNTIGLADDFALIGIITAAVLQFNGLP